jgi:hypothetical protein
MFGKKKNEEIDEDLVVNPTEEVESLKESKSAVEISPVLSTDEPLPVTAPLQIGGGIKMVNNFVNRLKQLKKSK